MRRWERPIHDFLMPYLRGAVSRVTGENIIPAEVRHRRDLDTLADMLNYLRDLRQAARDPEHRGRSDIFHSQTTCLPGRTIYKWSRAGEPPRPASCRRCGQELPAARGWLKAAVLILIRTLFADTRGEQQPDSCSFGTRLLMYFHFVICFSGREAACRQSGRTVPVQENRISIVRASCQECSRVRENNLGSGSAAVLCSGPPLRR